MGLLFVFDLFSYHYWGSVHHWGDSARNWGLRHSPQRDRYNYAHGMMISKTYDLYPSLRYDFYTFLAYLYEPPNQYLSVIDYHYI